MSKKRGNGEGNMRKRPDGLWEQTIMIGYSANGKRKRKSFYGRTQREVKAKVAEFHQQQALGLTTDPTSPSWNGRTSGMKGTSRR